jgi:hypothetical protein
MLGGWGILIAGLLSAALHCATFYIAWRSTVRAKTAEAWQSTAQAAQQAEAAAKSEMETHKAAAGRLEVEKMALAQDVGRLKAATDLSLLSKENQAEHRMIVETLTALQLTIQSVQAAGDARHERLLALITENTRAVMTAQSHSAQAFETLAEMLRAERAANGR